MGHALRSLSTAPRTMTERETAQRTRTCGAHPCTWLHRATVSRSREKAPINPDFRPRAERETAGQAPMPYAPDARISVSVVAGVRSVRSRPTSAAGKVLVVSLCIRSRPGNALLNIPERSLESPETRTAVAEAPTFGFDTRRSHQMV